jgi:cytochrome b6-f complex iron-sulfur subunit
MATETVQVVTKVWIAPGCIVCDACETTCPDVFDVRHDEDTCLIRPEALDAEFCKPRTADIIQAAEECPVDVIKFETIEVPADQAPQAATAAAPKKAVSHAEKAEPAAKADEKKKEPEADEAKPKTSPEKHAAKPKTPERPKAVDPAIQALLEAATVRGGAARILKPAGAAPAAVREMQKLSPDRLPPDARYAKVIEKSKPKKATEPSRRDVMVGLGWAAFGFGVGVPSLLGFGRFMMPNVLEEPDPKFRCGPLPRFAELNPGDVDEQFKLDGQFWVIREEDRIAAVSIICTHLGCIPTWLENERKFKCPCHGSGFTANGTNFEGPAPRPLERFKIYLESGMVIVDRSRKFLAMGPNDTAVWDDPEASISV